MRQINNIEIKMVKCATPEIGEMVYDYFNGALDPIEVRQFERHLVSCRCCESTILQLDEVILQSPFDADRGTGNSGIAGLGVQTALIGKLCV